MTNPFARWNADRAKELNRMSKRELAAMHVQYGGLLGFLTYAKWSKDELVNTILQDESMTNGDTPCYHQANPIDHKVARI